MISNYVDQGLELNVNPPSATLAQQAGSDGPLSLVVAEKRYWVRNPAGSDVCNQGCAYQVIKLFKGMQCAVLSMVLCTVKKLLVR